MANAVRAGVSSISARLRASLKTANSLLGLVSECASNWARLGCIPKGCLAVTQTECAGSRLCRDRVDKPTEKMSAPYWEVLTPKQLQSLRLQMTFKEWMKLNDSEKWHMRFVRDEIKGRMLSSFTSGISSDSICISAEQFATFEEQLKDSQGKEAEFQVELYVHKLDRAPFLALSLVGIATTIGFGWLAISKDQGIWVYASPLVGLALAWYLFRARQMSVRAEYQWAVHKLNEAKGIASQYASAKSRA